MLYKGWKLWYNSYNNADKTTRMSSLHTSQEVLFNNPECQQLTLLATSLNQSGLDDRTDGGESCSVRGLLASIGKGPLRRENYLCKTTVHIGRLAQRQSSAFTRRRSEVRSLYLLPFQNVSPIPFQGANRWLVTDVHLVQYVLKWYNALATAL